MENLVVFGDFRLKFGLFEGVDDLVWVGDGRGWLWDIELIGDEIIGFLFEILLEIVCKFGSFVVGLLIIDDI